MWVAFGVILALLPLFINFLMLRLSGKPFAWYDLSSRGELFLVAAAISADALSRLWLRRLIPRPGATLCFIGCFYALILASVEFSLVKQSFSRESRMTDSPWLATH